MAKIIKVGSQNPTFTSQTKKASSIQTHRNSNEATNPFKFTNFEGNTLQFADVFEGFKPNFKTSPANKMRMIASSAAGSMTKVKSNIIEPIVAFVNRVSDYVSGKCSRAWDYAVNTNISDIPGLRQTKEFLLAERHLPASMQPITTRMTSMKEEISSRISDMNRSMLDMGKEMTAKWSGIVSNVSFHGRQKYSNMSVAELEVQLASALAEGGINE